MLASSLYSPPVHCSPHTAYRTLPLLKPLSLPILPPLNIDQIIQCRHNLPRERTCARVRVPTHLQRKGKEEKKKKKGKEERKRRKKAGRGRRVYIVSIYTTCLLTTTEGIFITTAYKHKHTHTHTHTRPRTLHSFIHSSSSLLLPYLQER